MPGTLSNKEINCQHKVQMIVQQKKCMNTAERGRGERRSDEEA